MGRALNWRRTRTEVVGKETMRETRNQTREPVIQPPGRGMRFWRALGAVALVLFVVSPAAAQSRDDILRELENTDRIIEKARDVVSTSDNSLAREYLEQAVKLQNFARSAFTVDRLADVVRITRQARERAFTAVRIAEQSGSAEFLRFMLERTAALLDRIAPIIRESRVEIAHRLLDAALEQQRRAQEALFSGHPRAALSLTFQARERAMRALRRSESSEESLVDRAGRAVERTDGLLSDSAWLSEAGDNASATYRSAMQIQTQARDRLDSGQFAAALRLSQRARERLVRALNQADRPLDREAVGDALRKSQERLERVTDRTSGKPEEEAVARAGMHLRRAADHFERGRLAACLAEIRAVRGVLDRAGL